VYVFIGDGNNDARRGDDALYTGWMARRRPHALVLWIVHVPLLLGAFFGLQYLPLLAVPVLFVLVVARSTIQWTHNRKLALAGLCPECGYDLRATPLRCPECGREVTEPHY